MNKTFLATALIAIAVYSNVFAAEGKGDGLRQRSPRGQAAGVVYVEQGVYAADLASLREDLGLNTQAVGVLRKDFDDLVARVAALENEPSKSPKAESAQGPVVGAVQSHARDIAELEKTVKLQAVQIAQAQRTVTGALWLASGCVGGICVLTYRIAGKRS